MNLGQRLAARAETLAAFRIAVGFALLFSSEIRGAVAFAALPEAQRIPPWGLAWFAHAAPISVSIALITRALAFGSAVATMLGVYTRAATLVLAVTTFYLLSLGQLGGTVVHNMHLVWFAIVLAASRSGDAWSVDAWWDARERGVSLVAPATSVTYGVPVWTARLLLAGVYFFPGFHKVLAQGLGWASADNLALQLQWKWFEWNDVPAFRLDQHPLLLSLGGFGTLAFELGFPLLLLTRPTRVLAAAAGLAFHLATDHFFRIPFSSLWLCYPVLFDWGRSPTADLESSPWPRAETAVAVMLLSPVAIQGFVGRVDAYPFGCYPTFEHRPPSFVPDLRIVAIHDDGTETEVPHARDAHGVRAQADWGRIWALAGATHPVDERRLREYVATVEHANPAGFSGAMRVDVRCAQYSVVPDDRGKPPQSEQLLVTLPRATR
jgi:hypothetical protein